MSNNNGTQSHEAPERVTWRGREYGFGGDGDRTEVVEVMTADNSDLRNLKIEGNTFLVSDADGFGRLYINEEGREVYAVEAVPVRLDMSKPSGPRERYRCKAGHEWEDDLYRVRFYRYPLPVLGGGIESVLEADSGPLCALCYAAALREQFGGRACGDG